jgi:hypothetical protein
MCREPRGRPQKGNGKGVAADLSLTARARPGQNRPPWSTRVRSPLIALVSAVSN